MTGSSPPADSSEPQPAAECCGGESHCSSDPTQSGHGVAELLALREGCPPPLQWPQVLATFRDEAETWESETAAGLIRGRVWGQGPPLVMLNGLAGSHELFALAAFLLKPQFRCVLLDYPTDGRTTWPKLADSVTDVAGDFLGDGGYLFGTSIGSALALEVALKCPMKVRGLVLHAAFAHLRLTWFERCGASLFGLIPGRIEGVSGWQSLQERCHRLWFPPIDPTRWSFYLADAGLTRITDVARRFGLLNRCDLRPRLKSLQCPTLLIHTEGEGATQQRCRDELAALLPHACTEFLHTTGLLTFLTHPHRLAKLIREFAAPSVAQAARL